MFTRFVEGGGWVLREIECRPKARAFASLSVLWLLVVVAASVALGGVAGRFTVLWWGCVALIVPEPIFVALAVYFGLTEQPQRKVEQVRNPDCDLRNLY